MPSDKKSNANQTAQELFAGSMGGVVQVGDNGMSFNTNCPFPLNRAFVANANRS